MHFVRKAGLVLLSVLLPVLLYATASTAAIDTAFGNPEKIKDSFRDSNIYSKLVDALVNQLNSSEDKQGQDMQIDKAALKSIAETALPPEFLQSSFENIIDGTFHWIEGKTDKPDFRVDLTDAKNRLADGLITYTTNRAATLPACTPAQSAELAQQGDINPLMIPCKPPKINLDAEIQRQVAEFKSSDQFLKDTVITADDLTVDDGKGGKRPFFDQAEGVPRLFKLLAFSSVVFGLLSLLSAAGIVMLSNNRKQGLRKLGHILMITGAVVLAFALIIQFGLSRAAAAVPGKTETEEKLFQDVVLPLLRELVGNLNKVYIIFGAAYILIAIAIFVILWQLNKRSPEHTATEASTESKPENLESKIEEEPKTEEPESEKPKQA